MQKVGFCAIFYDSNRPIQLRTCLKGRETKQTKIWALSISKEIQNDLVGGKSKLYEKKKHQELDQRKREDCIQNY